MEKDILPESPAIGALRTAGAGQETRAWPVRPREKFAWASLDFANSGYTTVVLTAVFNAYFVSSVASDPAQGTLLWTLILSASYLLILALAPWIGAYADATGAKRRLLVWATLLCVGGTLGLALVRPGDIVWAAVCLLLSNLAYATHQDLSAAFLVELAEPQDYGSLSGYGWAWGYVGGLFTLGLSLAWIQLAPALMGVDQPAASVLVAGSLVITATVFALVGLPALAVLRERATPSHQPWQLAWARLLQGWRSLADRALRQFLVCVMVYQAGVSTVITLAAVYAQQQMGFGLTETLLLVLVVNITASIGAAGFGRLEDRIGHRAALTLSLLLWMLMIAVAALSTSSLGFWVSANLAGLAMGSSQSSARAMVAGLAPAGQEAEVFGYWGVAVNLAAVIGPLGYGLVVWLTGNDHQLALLATSVYFVLGLVLLLRIRFPARLMV